MQFAVSSHEIPGQMLCGRAGEGGQAPVSTGRENDCDNRHESLDRVNEGDSGTRPRVSESPMCGWPTRSGGEGPAEAAGSQSMQFAVSSHEIPGQMLCGRAGEGGQAPVSTGRENDCDNRHESLDRVNEGDSGTRPRVSESPMCGWPTRSGGEGPAEAAGSQSM